MRNSGGHTPYLMQLLRLGFLLRQGRLPRERVNESVAFIRSKLFLINNCSWFYKPASPWDVHAVTRSQDQTRELAKLWARRAAIIDYYGGPKDIHICRDN